MIKVREKQLTKLKTKFDIVSHEADSELGARRSHHTIRVTTTGSREFCRSESTNGLARFLALHSELQPLSSGIGWHDPNPLQ